MQFYAALITAAGDADAIAAVMDEHHRYMAAVDRAGKILASGPFQDTGGGPAGMIIFATPTIAEAQKLMDGEPLTARGLRTYDLRPWRVNEGTLRTAPGLADAGTSGAGGHEI